MQRAKARSRAFVVAPRLLTLDKATCFAVALSLTPCLAWRGKGHANRIALAILLDFFYVLISQTRYGAFAKSKHKRNVEHHFLDFCMKKGSDSRLVFAIPFHIFFLHISKFRSKASLIQKLSEPIFNHRENDENSAYAIY